MTDPLAYIERALDGFGADPPDSDHQKGYLAALLTVRFEAFELAPDDRTNALTNAAERTTTEQLGRAAAHQAARATQELVRFVAEGPHGHTAFEEDTIEYLADALKIALEIDHAVGSSDPERAQLHTALSTYLGGWA
ncbi:MAG TPA: hypothetical protein VF628_02180 [Allosphingosinicella sp.]|jgi:hypothetical protein